MNQKNYQYLSDKMDNLGFTDPKLKEFLKQKIDSNLFDEFSLPPARAVVGNEKLDFELHFVRSNDPQYKDYFNLNRTILTITPDQGEIVKFKFPEFKSLSFNTEQMYLMAKENAPVYKKDRYEKIGQWAKIDPFRNLDEDKCVRVRTYPDDVTHFNLETHLDKLKVHWARGEKELALTDLQNGLHVKVAIKQDGITESATIKVGPQMNSLIILNSDNKIIQKTNTSSISVQVVEEVKNDNKLEKAKELADNMMHDKKEVKTIKKAI